MDETTIIMNDKLQNYVIFMRQEEEDDWGIGYTSGGSGVSAVLKE